MPTSKNKSLTTSNLTCKELEKEQSKLKASRRKEITKITAEIS